MFNFVSTCAQFSTNGGLLGHNERLDTDSEMRGKPGTLNCKDRGKGKY